MAFEIKGKVALITGGASGIGLHYAKELLRNELRAVTLADVNSEFGEKALAEIDEEFGANKALFVQTDVTNKQSLEDAFKKTINVFNNLDILVNNAGILSDSIWEKEVAVNINGVIQGTILGLETYIPQYKSGEEGVIVNISSIAGTQPFPCFPFYTATKFAVLGFSKCVGDEVHYNRTKVKVLTLCPGVTSTPLILESGGKSFSPAYEVLAEELLANYPQQKPEDVAVALVEIVKNANTGTIWVIESGLKLYEFQITDRQSFATT